jgi:ABC-type glycerol-3-phosphate transport system substrate-binding protein
MMDEPRQSGGVDPEDPQSTTVFDRTMERGDLLKRAGLGLAGLATVGGGSLLGAAQAIGATSKSTKKITLRYIQNWHSGNDAHAKVLDAFYKSFEKKHPNVTINSEDASTTAFPAKITSGCAAHNCPDLIHQVSEAYWHSGWLLDLKPYMSKEWRGRFYPGALDALSLGNHIFALPLEFSPLVTVWNTELLKSLGKQVPKTWAQYLDLGKAAKAQGLFLASFPSYDDGVHILNDIIWQRPGGAQAMAKGQWDNPAVRYALTRLKELVDLGYNNPTDASIDYGASISLFQQKKVVSFQDGAWTISNNMTPGGKDTFGLAGSLAFSYFPVTEGAVGPSMRIFSNGVGLARDLKKDPAKLKAALEFMNMWTSRQEATAWMDSQSPTGVKAPVPAKYPLLKRFLAAQTGVKTFYTGAYPLVLRSNMWNHLTTASQAVMLGKSVDDAVQIYVAYMKKLGG